MEDNLKFETICTLAHLCKNEAEYLETIKRLRKFTPEQIKQHIELYHQVKDNPLGHLKNHFEKGKEVVSQAQKIADQFKGEIFGLNSNGEER